MSLMPHNSDACHVITDYMKGEAWGGVQQHDVHTEFRYNRSPA